jgi:hypothetical protein
MNWARTKQTISKRNSIWTRKTFFGYQKEKHILADYFIDLTFWLIATGTSGKTCEVVLTPIGFFLDSIWHLNSHALLLQWWWHNND